MNGKFYGVSVGPGDPELITVKAVNIIKKCSVIIVPQTKNENMLALSIARQSVDMTDKLIVSVKFLMSHDIEKTQENHKRNAETIMEYLRRGYDAAMLNIGDVSVYSTCSYILSIIEKNGFETEVCAGVPSFCAAAARLKKPLVSRREVLVVAPGYSDELESLIKVNGTKVIMKSGKHINRVKKLVEDYGMSDNTVIVESCGLKNEKIRCGIDETENGYFSLMIIKNSKENNNA